MTARSRSRSQGVSPDDGDQNELSALHARDLQMEAGKMRKGKNRGRQSKKSDAEDDFEQEGGKKGAMSPASLSANAWLWCPILVIVLIPVTLLCFRFYNIDHIGSGMDLLSTSVKGSAQKALVPGQGAGMVSPSSSAFLETLTAVAAGAPPSAAPAVTGAHPLIGVAGTFQFAEPSDEKQAGVENLIGRCERTSPNGPKGYYPMPAAAEPIFSGSEGQLHWSWRKGDGLPPGCFLIHDRSKAGAQLKKVVVFTGFGPSTSSGKLGKPPSSPLFAMHGVMRAASHSEKEAYRALDAGAKQGKTTGPILGRVDKDKDMGFLPSITRSDGRVTGGYIYDPTGATRVFEILAITPAESPVVASTYYFEENQQDCKTLSSGTAMNVQAAFRPGFPGPEGLVLTSWKKEGVPDPKADLQLPAVKGFFQTQDSCYIFAGAKEPARAAFAAHGLMRQALTDSEDMKKIESDMPAPSQRDGRATADIMCKYPNDPNDTVLVDLCVPQNTPMWFSVALHGWVYDVTVWKKEGTSTSSAAAAGGGEITFQTDHYVVFKIQAWENQPTPNLIYV